jgi:hypothetical protein
VRYVKNYFHTIVRSQVNLEKGNSSPKFPLFDIFDPLNASDEERNSRIVELFQSVLESMKLDSLLMVFHMRRKTLPKILTSSLKVCESDCQLLHTSNIASSVAH